MPSTTTTTIDEQLAPEQRNEETMIDRKSSENETENSKLSATIEQLESKLQPITDEMES